MEISHEGEGKKGLYIMQSTCMHAPENEEEAFLSSFLFPGPLEGTD